MTSFRDRFFTPKVARAITSPSAILVAGAGVSVGIVAGLGVLAPVVGAVALGARVLAAVPRDNKKHIDVRSLSEPWKSLLREILDSGTRFRRAISGMQSGPLAERLAELAERLDTAIDEAGRIALAGNQLTAARTQIDTARVLHDLETARAESPAGDAPQSSRRDQTIHALEAQLASAARIDATTRDTYEQLRLLDARIDEMVARSVELSVSQSTGDDVGGLGEEVEGIVSDMENLRQALEETH